MDSGNVIFSPEMLHPILFIPKTCTNLETNCEVTDNLFIEVNITSPDTEGNQTCIYSGFCNIKLIDHYDVNYQDLISSDGSRSEYTDDQVPVLITDSNAIAESAFNDSEEIWIDPSRSPYVYNSYDSSDSQKRYICQETHTSHITVEQHNTYITKNVYNYKEAVHYAPAEDFDAKKYKKVQENTQKNYTEAINVYEEDEFECGVFLSHLPEEIMNEKESKAREERRYVGLQTENGALKQLMSSDMQSMSKQQKTILFLGQDPHYGQTVQKIDINDPSLGCPIEDIEEVDHEIVIDNIDVAQNKKKYQCAKCQQMFDQISAFRQHMVSHKARYTIDSKPDLKFLCLQCGKNLKTREKFEIHCLGHGNPELECSKCHKVFASKFTLRAHGKIHARQFSCAFCSRTYSKVEELNVHAAKNHSLLMCDACDFVTNKNSELATHKEIHEINSELMNHEEIHESDFKKDSSETDQAESCDVLSESDMITPSPEGHDWRLDSDDDDDDDKALVYYNDRKRADSVIAKVMSNSMFLSKKAKKHKRFNKTCDVCLKRFDRVSDLKRHLIEHVVRSTLAKIPVNRHGYLNIQCEVCQIETFNKVDKYKAHLREHAKLTLYQCTFCNKSFSDSSNFSKHKKVHGWCQYFECDLCQRKFNSKKMITLHMEYHMNNPPLLCKHCGKSFHFKSMLNKHVKSAHTEKHANFRCRFCHKCYRTLKDKWEHEWSIHNVRKMIVDCLVCGNKFRKYSELKRHCHDKHDLEIPPAKKLLRNKIRT